MSVWQRGPPQNKNNPKTYPNFGQGCAAHSQCFRVRLEPPQENTPIHVCNHQWSAAAISNRRTYQHSRRRSRRRAQEFGHHLGHKCNRLMDLGSRAKIEFESHRPCEHNESVSESAGSGFLSVTVARSGRPADGHHFSAPSDLLLFRIFRFYESGQESQDMAIGCRSAFCFVFSHRSATHPVCCRSAKSEFSVTRIRC
jgi:hypothetical protein